jgi:hypothetical protein
MFTTVRCAIASRLAAGLAGAVVAIGIGGAASAMIPDSGGVIHACYQKVTGQLRVVDSATPGCTADEVAISWNQQGPSGSTLTINYRVGGMVPGTSVARAFCLPYEKVTGGGGLSTDATQIGLSQSFPISDSGGAIAFGTTAIGWQVASETFGNVQAFVICAS